MEGIDLAQDKNMWRALVKGVMNFRVHKMCEISRLAEELSASQGGLCYTDAEGE
jgi:hypothetical protein